MSASPVILALDQSSRQTGWARGRPEGPVSVGSYSNPKCGQRYGLALRAYKGWVVEQLAGVDMIVIEQPVRPDILNLHTARLLYGIAGVIEMTAEECGVKCLEADTNEMKRLAYGKAGKKPDPAVARRKIAAWGIEVANGDEADAAGVWLWTVKERFPEAFKGWLGLRSAAA